MKVDRAHGASVERRELVFLHVILASYLKKLRLLLSKKLGRAVCNGSA